jgi:hypothetical protein
MCIFCATAPLALAAGAGWQAQQQRAAKEMTARGEEPKKPVVSPMPVALMIFVGLLIASTIFHSLVKT